MTTEQEDHRSRRHVWRRLSETQARLDALLAVAEPILNDLHTGVLLLGGWRADTNRNAHERRLAAAIEAAKEVGA